MTLREYFDNKVLSFFRMIVVYEDGGLIGRLPVSTWRRSKYKDREVLEVDGYVILVKGVSI